MSTASESEVALNNGAFAPRTRIVFGPGAADRAGALAAELGVRRAFVVTDPGIVAVGHVARVEVALAAAGIEVRHYADVRQNPTTADVYACRAALGDWDAELLIGVGGGSSIDVAKGCAFIAAGGGRMEDYRGRGLARGTLLPLMAVPTTAGTGTETQSFALIGQEETQQKMACGDPQAAPKISILDPELTVSQPPFVTACTGLDTLVHAVETAVTKPRNAISRAFSFASFRCAQAELPNVLREPEDLDARARMMLASAWAGLAIEHSMLGAAHSMANPLTARFAITHGQAVGLMLPHVVRFNAREPEVAQVYAELARQAELCSPGAEVEVAAAALVACLEGALAVAGFDPSLAAYNVPRSAIDTLAAEAAAQWTARFNPRTITQADFRRLYEGACA